jgi:hypothetical protein
MTTGKDPKSPTTATAAALTSGTTTTHHGPRGRCAATGDNVPVGFSFRFCGLGIWIGTVV